jgi:cytochrome b involved in lipid metabolism
MENNSNKSVGIIIAVVLIAAIGGWVYYQKQKSLAPAPVPTYDTPATSAGSETTNPNAPAGITMAQVAQHNSKASCWASISGFVYDLTSWIPNHPGGEQNILQLCGTDGTAKFNGQHGNDSRAKGVLAGFKIGTLAQ